MLENDAGEVSRPVTRTGNDLMSDLAELIVTSLNLEIAPDQIDPDARLFGEGLGLDSIDALELALEISRRYGVEIRSDDQQVTRIFASLRNLAAHIERKTA